MTDAKFWDAAAEKYARKPVGDPEAFERKIEVTKSRMTEQSVVLDIGCGTGSLTLRLAATAGHVHGLDISREMIRLANEKASQQGVDNVTFHVGPFNDTFTTFEAGSFDLICAYSILHLVEDRAGALRRIFTLLRPGGTFISSTVVLGESRVPFGPLLRLMQLAGKAPTVRIFSKATLLEEMRQAGFVDLIQPDAGTKDTIAFIVASAPPTSD